MPLRTDYTNDVIDTSKNTERVYNFKDSNGQIINEGVRIEDITEYTQEGSKFGANDINATNQKVNELDANVYATNQKVNELDVNAVNGYGYNAGKTLKQMIDETVVPSTPLNRTKYFLVESSDGWYKVECNNQNNDRYTGICLPLDLGENAPSFNFSSFGGASTVIRPFSRKFTAVIRVTIQLAYQLDNTGGRAIQESTTRDITVNFDGKNITLSGWNTDWTDNMGNTGNNTRCTFCFHLTNVQLISFTML